MNSYIYAGFSESTRLDINDEYVAMILKSIKFRHLKRFINDRFPSILQRSRKVENITTKVAMIATLEKYRDIIFKDNGDKMSVQYLAINIFRNNHATYLHHRTKYNDIVNMNRKHGIYQDVIDRQKDVEIEFVKYFQVI